MPLADLTAAEREVVYDCLKCVAAGEVIAHDWEFHSLFGLEPREFQAVVGAWPKIDDKEEVVELAINNSLNSLLGLVDADTFARHIPHRREEVARIFSKWRGMSAGSYVEGLR
jgi:hypothetical protein